METYLNEWREADNACGWFVFVYLHSHSIRRMKRSVAVIFFRMKRGIIETFKKDSHTRMEVHD